jgi:uncharacterized membrane protein
MNIKNGEIKSFTNMRVSYIFLLRLIAHFLFPFVNDLLSNIEVRQMLKLTPILI